MKWFLAILFEWLWGKGVRAILNYLKEKKKREDNRESIEKKVNDLKEAKTEDEQKNATENLAHRL